MGAGASKRPAAAAASVEASVTSISALKQPFQRGNDKYFYAFPTDEEMRKKSQVMILEVGREGFRLLRPVTEDALYAFPWGQVHSWAHAVNKFTFRFFDDGKRAILQYHLNMRDIDILLEHIHVIIEQILSERRSSAISDEEFQQLLARMQAADPSMHLDVLTSVLDAHFFFSHQGKQLLDLMATPFDMVEAAVLLHARLVDQNRFSNMLDSLESQADKENVWHRITAAKKVAGPRSGGGATSPGPKLSRPSTFSAGGSAAGPASPTGAPSS